MADRGKKRKSSGIKVLVSPTRSTDPIVCSFPGGLPAAVIANNQNDGTKLPTFAYQPKSLVGQDDTCLYTATVAESSSQTTKLLLGIYDKHTKTLELSTTADNGALFALHQSVPDYDSQSNSNNNNAALSNPTTNSRSLYEDFGSAKKKKAIRSRQANQVNVESVVGSMPGIVSHQPPPATDIQQQQRDAIDAATLEWRQGFLPPYQESATEPQHVYSAAQIVGETGWNWAERVVEACLSKNDVVTALTEKQSGSSTEWGELSDREEWCMSTKQLAQALGPKGRQAKRQLKCTLVLQQFIALFLKLHQKRFIPGPEVERGRFFGSPFEVAVPFLERFATSVIGDRGTGYAMSKADKDRCYVQLMILYSMSSSDDMKVDNIQPIADDLKIDVKDAARLLRLAGFTVQRKTATGRTSAVLTTPLKFPAIKRRAGAKRGM